MKEAQWLIEFGFKLVPLCEDKGDKHYRKRPRDKGWLTKEYSLEQLQASFRRIGAIGARVPAGMCVIDIDTKEGKIGLQSLAKFPQEGLFDGSYVITGSGGFHIFFKLPAGVDRIDTGIRELPDIDFRVVGSQVVTAGSLNANGKSYEWDETTAETGEVRIPEMPEAIWEFLKGLQRPDISSTSTSDGSSSITDLNSALTRTEIEDLLASINVEDYRGHDEWLKIMMACHEASGGGLEGLEAFYAWSRGDSDKKRVVSKGELEIRWKSLRAGEAGGVTRRHLMMSASSSARAQVDFSEHSLALVGAPSRFVREDGSQITSKNEDEAKAKVRRLVESMGMNSSVSDSLTAAGEDFDFNFDPEDQNSSTALLSDDMLKGSLERLNDEFAYVVIGGKQRVAQKGINSYGQIIWDFLELATFITMLSNRPKIAVAGSDNALPIADAWLKWPGRRSYMRLDFFPGWSQEEVDTVHPGTLNLWSGWAIEPIMVEERLGNVSGFYKDVGAVEPPRELDQFVDLIGALSGAGRGHEHAQYLLDWLAFGFYEADSPIGVAVALRGKKGIGKGMLSQIMGKLVGEYYMPTSDMDHVIGKYNGNLRNTTFLFLDEALWSGNKTSARRFQTIITEPTISTESKGFQAITTRNCLHILLASNDEWVVPASGDDERRYCVFDSSDRYRLDSEFWRRIVQDYGLGRSKNLSQDQRDKAQYRLQLLLGWLLKRGEWLSKNNWRPAKDIPRTEALKEQHAQSKSAFDLWWDEVIEFGELGGVNLIEALEATSETEVFIWSQRITEDFEQSDHGIAFSKLRTYSGHAVSTQLGRFIAKKLPRSTKSLVMIPENLRLEIKGSYKNQARGLLVSIEDLKAVFRG